MPSKKEVGQQRKQEQKLQKQQEEASKVAKAHEEEWKKGANLKGVQRQQEAGASQWKSCPAITIYPIC
jgi:Ni/Co efflux regulator RcnB